MAGRERIKRLRFIAVPLLALAVVTAILWLSGEMPEPMEQALALSGEIKKLNF